MTVLANKIVLLSLASKHGLRVQHVLHHVDVLHQLCAVAYVGWSHGGVGLGVMWLQFRIKRLRMIQTNIQIASCFRFFFT